jgi:hypothetical protein
LYPPRRFSPLRQSIWSFWKGHSIRIRKSSEALRNFFKRIFAVTFVLPTLHTLLIVKRTRASDSLVLFKQFSKIKLTKLLTTQSTFLKERSQMSRNSSVGDVAVSGSHDNVQEINNNYNVVQQSQQFGGRGGNDGYFQARAGCPDTSGGLPECHFHDGGQGGGCEAPQSQQGGPFGSLFGGLPNPESLLSGLMGGGQGGQGGSPLSGLGSIMGNQGSDGSSSSGGSGGIGGTGITAGEVASVAAIFA